MPSHSRVGIDAPMPTPRPHTITLRGQTITYTVRRSARARYVRLRVSAQLGLEVVVPARGRPPEIAALLHERAEWILRTLDRIAAQEAARPAPTPLLDGATLPFQGGTLRVELRPNADARLAVSYERERATLMVRFDPAEVAPEAIIARWLRERARDVLIERAAHFAAQLGVRYARLTVRDTRTRWGSCSSRGGINFSWRLILAPRPVLDYVVIHELAHLRELNHSPRFWALVAAHCPDYAQHRAWLNQHGARLHTLLTPPEGEVSG